MHSRRMRTVHCSARFSCHSCSPRHACPPSPRETPPPSLPCKCPLSTPPLDRRNDTHLWKHYFSATTVADGNKSFCPKFYLYHLCESKTLINLQRPLSLYFLRVLPISVHLSAIMIFVIIHSSTFHLLRLISIAGLGFGHRYHRYLWEKDPNLNLSQWKHVLHNTM